MLVNAVFLQPWKIRFSFWLQALNLKLDNLTFTGKQGTRTIFGCSQGLRHHLSADCSSSTFANQPEFLHHWIAVLEFNIDRDWTWKASPNLHST